MSEKQPPKIVIRDTDCMNRINDQLDKAPLVNFEGFDAKALMNYQFRDTRKEKWRSKRGCIVSMKAPDMPLADYRMNQTGTDQPFEDGFENLGLKIYRKRMPERELTNTEFNRYTKMTTRAEEIISKSTIGSIRK